MVTTHVLGFENYKERLVLPNKQKIVTSVSSEHIIIIEYGRDEMSNRNCCNMIPLEFYSIDLAIHG